MKKKNKILGFTLIELLIAIAIVGVLSSLLMVNFIDVRQRARDAQRKSDVRQIQAALELYKSDNGTYPVYTGPIHTTGSPFIACTGQKFGVGATMPTCSTIYMEKVPIDPLPGTDYTGARPRDYYYASNGSTYGLRACLENKKDKDADQNTILCNSAGDSSTQHIDFRVANP